MSLMLCLPVWSQAQIIIIVDDFPGRGISDGQTLETDEGTGQPVAVLAAVQDRAGTNSVSVFPNPAVDHTYVETMPGVSVEGITIINAQGQLAFQVSNPSGAIPAPSVGPGVYEFCVSTNGGTFCEYFEVLE